MDNEVATRHRASKSDGMVLSRKQKQFARRQQAEKLARKQKQRDTTRGRRLDAGNKLVTKVEYPSFDDGSDIIDDWHAHQKAAERDFREWVMEQRQWMNDLYSL